MLPGYRYNEAHLWDNTETDPTKQRATYKICGAQSSECGKCFLRQ